MTSQEDMLQIERRAEEKDRCHWKILSKWEDIAHRIPHRFKKHWAAEGCCAPVDNCEVACVCKRVDHEIRDAVSERHTKDYKFLYRTMH